MLSVIETQAFATWLSRLKDRSGRAIIVARIERLRLTGSFGDSAPVGGGVSEMRFHISPGYRVYFCRRGEEIVFLLGGGDKATQVRDIRAAKALAKEI